MKIAVASGKGGTGKTTLATSLARSAAEGGTPVLFLDCDVEAPDAHLFLAPKFERREEVVKPVPVVDSARCDARGRCSAVCQYNAIAVLGTQVLVFAQLCHGCGSCARECPVGAISELPEAIGVLERGPAVSGIDFAHGVLNLHEPMASPVIGRLKQWVVPAPGQLAIYDAPPGTSCPVVETLRGVDYVLLVTEPTPFGLHDLRLAVQVARELRIPAGVVINRDGIGDAGVEAYCAAEDLPVLLRIPFETAISAGTARGHTLAEIHPEYAGRLRQMLAEMERLAGQRR